MPPSVPTKAPNYTRSGEDTYAIQAGPVKRTYTGDATATGGSGDLSAYYNSTQVDDLLDDKSDVGHNHDERYFTEAEITSLLAGKSDTSHNHDSRYYTETETDALLAGKSATGHTHDDRYFTEAEVTSLLAGYSTIGHDHDGLYYTEEEIDAFLAEKADESHAHSEYQPLNGLLTLLGALLLEGNEGYRIAVNSAGTGFELVPPSTDTAEEKQWINISATGTGSSQNITLYEEVDQTQVFLWVAGSAKVPGTDFTVSGLTLTGTFTNAAAILIRYLGTVEGSVPVNSVAPSISGGTDVGDTLNLDDEGTWSNSPTSYEYRWRRNGAYISGETGATFLVTTGTDIGANIDCEVTAINSFGEGVAVSNALGPIIAAPDISTPVLTQTSSAGDALDFTIDIDNDVYAGYYIQFQLTSAGTGSAGDYTTPDQDFEYPITASDIAEALSGSVAISFDELAAAGYSSPTGEFWMRAKITREDGVTSGWSNELHDTIVASVAVLVTTTGTNKSQYVNVTGTPALVFTGNLSGGSRQLVRTTTVAVNDKFHFEVTVGALNTGGAIHLGIVDSAVALGTGFSPLVGQSAAGCMYRANQSGNGTVYRNGGNANTTEGATQVGDALIVEGNRTTNQIVFKRRRSGVTTTVSTITMTSQIPTTWTAFVGTRSSVDSGTANFGATSFAATPSTGYDIYG